MEWARGQVVEVLTQIAAPGSSCQDLDIRPRQGLAFDPAFDICLHNTWIPEQLGKNGAPIGAALTSSLTALNISRCGLGGHLTAAITGLAELSPTLTSLDVSNNNASGLLPALCGTLRGNRSLTALKVCGNQLDFEGVQCLRKLFGDVNAQSGVLWGNKTIVSLDVPSKAYQGELQSGLLQLYQRQIQQGHGDMAQGQQMIKSAYRPDWRRPNEGRKAAGIAQKVEGKNSHGRYRHS